MSNIEDFLETINYVPVDMRRNLGLLRELEYQEQKVYETLKEYQSQLMSILKASSTRENDQLKLELKDKVERTHLKSLALRREKILIAMQTYKIVQQFNQGFDVEVQKFEEEFRNIPIQEFVAPVNNVSEELTQNTRNGGQGKRNRDQIGSYQQLIPQFDSYQYPTYSKSQRDKQKSKKLPLQLQVPQEIPLDEASYNNDPTPYCYCRQPSYGYMVGCENSKNCKYEWFHIGCVGLDEIPRDDVQWFCPDCLKNRDLNQL